MLAALRAAVILGVSVQHPTGRFDQACDQAILDWNTNYRSDPYRYGNVGTTAVVSLAALDTRNSNRLAFRTGDVAALAASVLRSPEHDERQTFWQAVTDDVNALVLTGDPIILNSCKLWLNGSPRNWNDEFARFQLEMSRAGATTSNRGGGSGNWKVWAEWYSSAVAGNNSFSLSRRVADALDQRIALGGGRKGFWDREPAEVNAEIAGWVADARRAQNAASRVVFISYNSSDKIAAKDVGDAIDSFGFQSFAQYKDMPPGSNFIAEMQDGLATMGKFTPLYSPDYMASDICQAEWNAAYNMDRLGKRRLIIGFLLKPTTLLPLQQQVVHVPLYGLTKEKARSAIFDALTGNGEMASPAQSRRDAADNASPEPVIDADGRIGVSPDAEVEAAFIDDELANLPDSMRRLLANLALALPGRNAPVMLSQNLADYRTELALNGASPRIADLIRCAEIIKSEICDAIELEAAWYRAGIAVSLEQFLDLHEKLRQRFPIMMLRDQIIARSVIDPSVFDKPGFVSSHKTLSQAAAEAHRDDLTTEEFNRVIEWRERQRKDIASLRDPQNKGADDLFLTSEDRIQPSAIKKRFLFDMSGTGDKLLERTEKVTKIADSGAGQMLIGATRELLKLIWGG